MHKKQRTGHISEAISPTHFIPKVKGQGQIFPKMGKYQRTGHKSNAISPTDFILGTKVQPNKTHSLIQVPMTLTEGQGQRSRSNFPKNW